MELVDGWDLATVLARGTAARQPLPIGLGLYVVAQVCRALAYAHGKKRDGKALGIVHRDISPQNVLVSEQGEVKLTDFGIAKALGKRERTQTGVIKGKLDFMSPEQALGSVLDARSDIFSVGTVLYVLATGHRPFERGTELEALVHIQNAEFPPPEEFAPDVDPAVSAIIKRAMQKRPADRYPRADDMMRDVEEALRTKFGSVGQSELEAYLRELGRRDKIQPISRAPGLPVDPADEEETSPEGKRAATPAEMEPTLSVAEAKLLAGNPNASGAVPSAPLDYGETEHVSRRRFPWLGAIVAVVVVLALAGGALAMLWPQTARQLVQRGQSLLGGAGGASEAPRTREGRTDRRAVARATAPEPAPRPDPPPAPEPAAEPAPAPKPEPPPHVERTPHATLVTVQLRSHPSGATVRSRTGGVVGTTPLSLSLRTGSVQHWTFSKPGYKALTKRVPVGPSDHVVRVDLSRSRR
jgi:hypothetical protein